MYNKELNRSHPLHKGPTKATLGLSTAVSNPKRFKTRLQNTKREKGMLKMTASLER